MSPGGTGAKPQTKEQMKTPRYVVREITTGIPHPENPRTSKRSATILANAANLAAGYKRWWVVDTEWARQLQEACDAAMPPVLYRNGRIADVG